MKVKGKNGKEYEYSYQAIFFKPEVAQKFQELRKTTGITHSELLTILMKLKK